MMSIYKCYMDKDDSIIFFSKLITKSLTATESDRRMFEGILSVEMVDKQNEITIIDELMKVLPIWVARGAPISDTHSNRIIGHGINYAKTVVKDLDGTELPAITIQGEIFKDYELDNQVWEGIKSGSYRGLSFGGATKANRKPILQKDGSTSYALLDLEHYEVAVCPDPAVPLALITQFNPLAKANMGDKATMRDDNTMVIRCTKYGCHIKKDMESQPGHFSDTNLVRDSNQTRDPYKKEHEISNRGYRSDNNTKKFEGSVARMMVEEELKRSGTDKNPKEEPRGKEELIGNIDSRVDETPRGTSKSTWENKSSWENLPSELKKWWLDEFKKVFVGHGIDASDGSRNEQLNVDKDKTKEDYDLTGIVEDPKERKPKEKYSNPGQTMSANEGVRGKLEGINEDEKPEGLKKADIMFGNNTGVKGSYDTAEQGPDDTRQITEVRDGKKKFLGDKLSKISLLLIAKRVQLEL